MRTFLAQYWFLAALVAMLALGTWAHGPLSGLAAATWLRDGNMALVLFVMSLPLEFSALWRTLKRPAAPLLATAVSYILAPLAAICLAPLLGKEFGPGLLVAAATPCTMASAAVWTRKAGGNDAVSLVVTAITNIVCFLVTPTLLVWTAGEAARGVSIPVAPLMKDLMLFVVLPIFAGQLARLIGPVGDFASRQKYLLSMVAQCGILFMVLLAAIKTGQRLAAPGEAAGTTFEFALMIIAVAGLHLFLFYAGLGLARLCNLEREDRLAVGFCGSQKTLMVGLRVADDCGFSVLPMICYHVLQLFIDTILAERLKASEPPTAEPAKMPDARSKSKNPARKRKQKRR